ncbi:MAG: hypothetical protein GTN67_00180, partial [Hydrotalea flava]|nr:hypothetical protein [Hydrotalea flava]NIM36750.1 hypothetical protein [Hydrotalea flava]NIN13594.1 hypothetical protein [Hydrotalea flava]NIO92676.1 hypothetical protein [Hydrotalea flava]NIQ49079.1 hypothetical protein [Hydrotalea flava]
HLTIDQAKELYFTDYWLKNRYGELISQKIAEQIFDLAVNIGSNPANKIAQSAFNFLSFCLFNYAHNILQLTVDGLIGEKTIAALN